MAIPVAASAGDLAGCTPGFWKNLRQHQSYWTGFSPGDDFDTVFGVTSSFDSDLEAALRRGGGGENAMGRHAVAALLNAANPNINYIAGLNTAQEIAEVIADVQAAYASGDFEGGKDYFEMGNILGRPGICD